MVQVSGQHSYKLEAWLLQSLAAGVVTLAQLSRAIGNLYYSEE
jgi:hypothetical protein